MNLKLKLSGCHCKAFDNFFVYIGPTLSSKYQNRGQESGHGSGNKHMGFLGNILLLKLADYIVNQMSVNLSSSQGVSPMNWK